MKKEKIIGSLLILIVSTSIATLVLAQESEVVSKVVPSPPHRYPIVHLAQGVALERETLETEPVIFIVMKFKGETKSYLIVGSEVYTMEKMYERYDWETGTKVFQYEAEDGSVMTLIVQRYPGGTAISADFKNYLISFEPLYVRPIRPLKPRIVSEVERKLGEEIDITDILRRPVRPISEWVE